MIEHILLGFFIGSTIYLWYVNWLREKDIEQLVELSTKLMGVERTLKDSEK